MGVGELHFIGNKNAFYSKVFAQFVCIVVFVVVDMDCEAFFNLFHFSTWLLFTKIYKRYGIV
jgi:hypothetical protein